MLYQIFDKHDRLYHTLQCEPAECESLLRAMPDEGAPYSAHALPTGKQKLAHRYRSITVRHPHGTGVLLGVIGSAPFYYGLYLLLRQGICS